MKEKLIIIGAGGHSKVVADAVDESKYEIVGMLEKDKTRVGESINGIKIIGTDDEANFFYKQGIQNAVIGIGHLGNPLIRTTIFKKLKLIGFSMINVIHKTAVISKDAVLGEGNVILPNVTINSGAQIGDNNIINTGAIVEHEVIIENNVHLAPGTITCGMCIIGNNTFVGAGSTIIQGIKISSNTLVGAGSTVISSVQEGTHICGTPARRMKGR